MKSELIAMNFGSTEIILIVAVLFLLFGASRLPQLAKSLGQSRKAFKEGMREAEEEEAAETPKITSGTPKAAQLSDAEIEAEMARRAEARVDN
jgi:sec-independent protein translocase protein TatA